MTVEEFIEWLQDFPRDYTVIIGSIDEGTAGEVIDIIEEDSTHNVYIEVE